jgi:hypothetical protein
LPFLRTDRMVVPCHVAISLSAIILRKGAAIRAG